MMEMDTPESMNREQIAQETPSTVAPQEKMLSQAEVNEVVGRVRHEGYQKGKKDALAEAQGSPTSNPQLSEDQLRQMMREEASRIAEDNMRQAMAQQIIGDFANKMEIGKSKYSDFEEKVAALDLPKIPEIIELTNAADNTADVMYDLANNPGKIGILLNLRRMAPHLAMQEIRRLSDSIKVNQKASDSVATPREPLNQLKPSPAATDSGQVSVSDFRRQSWAKR